MKIKYFAAFLFLLFTISADAQRIKVYFNSPVDTSVSTGVKAINLDNLVDDTLVAYINRAHSTIDIAVYNFIQSNFANIATAINNAYANGVKIRWIYNESSSNSGLSQLNSGIHTLSSPAASNYGIMHDKFMIIDANSPIQSEPIVWTGSCNWDYGQFYSDINNIIIFQDADMAHAYTAEFNEMWGDTGLVPNLTNSKFGFDKTDNTQHLFNIDGTIVEQYFSPSDNMKDHLAAALSSADDDLYFGVYTFTEDEFADSIKNKIQHHNVYSAGIVDQFSQGYSPYSTLQPVMNNMLKVYTQSNSIYHNKLVIVDPCSPLSDPLVETGSYNWTVSAETKNDENSVIIHDDTIANLYYQSFSQNFKNLNGTLIDCNSSSGIQTIDDFKIEVFPNPATNRVNISSPGNGSQLTVYNSTGIEIAKMKLNDLNNNLDFSDYVPGIYLLKINYNFKIFSKILIVSSKI